jgi:hypothetical protein
VRRRRTKVEIPFAATSSNYILSMFEERLLGYHRRGQVSIVEMLQDNIAMNDPHSCYGDQSSYIVSCEYCTALHCKQRSKLA